MSDHRVHRRWQVVALVVAAGVAMSLRAGAAEPQQSDIEHAKSLSRAFRRVAEAVMPAVVKIKAKASSKVVRGGENPFKGTPFEDLFNEDERFRQFRAPSKSAMGSGVIIDAKGIVLTNNHVVRDADEVVVEMDDGTEYKAVEVKQDPQTDLAVIRIDPAGKLPVARLGNSDALDIGDWVIAIGHPFELEKTVSAGIISAKGRQLSTASRASFLQTDAAINPGNSGGPLVNLDGEVIGINSAIASSSGGYQGVGFAVPSNLAQWVADQLMKHGGVQRAYIGVQIGPLSPDLAKQFGVPLNAGVLIANVHPNSPAAEAGLQPGDVVTEYNGQKVTNARELQQLVERSPNGTSFPVRVLREGKSVTINVTVRALPGQGAVSGVGPKTGPAAPSGRHTDPDLGLTVGPLSADVAEQLGFKGTQGVLIEEVEPDSPAAGKGLQAGMVIVRVGKSPVASLEEYQAAMAEQPRDRGVLLLVRTRDDRQFFVVLKK